MQWYGKVGFTEQVKTGISLYKDVITERPYYGELQRLSMKDKSSDSINHNFTISNSLSIVSDPFGMSNFHKIRYVTLGDSKWTVSSVEVAYPRLNLTLGELYNEDEETEDEESSG